MLERPTSIKKDTVEQKESITSVWEKALKESEFVEIKSEDRNNEGKLLVSPDGPVSNLQNELYWKVVRTPSFIEWFGDWKNSPTEASSIVDENGEPMLTYHATGADFDKIDPEKGKRFKLLGKGAYFANDPVVGRLYGDRVFTCFLNAKKLVFIPEEGEDLKSFVKTVYYSFVQPKDTATYNQAKLPGHDYTKKSEINQICVFRGEQVMILPSDISSRGD